MTQVKEIKLGDKFYCFHKRLDKPVKGTVIALTNRPGKMIGLQFPNKMGGHECDGKGKKGHCLWVTPQHILTEQEWKKEQAHRKKKAKEEAAFKDDLEVIKLS